MTFSISRKNVFCAKFCHLGHAIHNNSVILNASFTKLCHLGGLIHNDFVTLDRFYVILDQQVIFLVTLDIVTKENLSTSVRSILVSMHESCLCD